jgi:hypothetical protein
LSASGGALSVRQRTYGADSQPEACAEDRRIRRVNIYPVLAPRADSEVNPNPLARQYAYER